MAKQVYRVDSPVIGKIHDYFESQAAGIDGSRTVARPPTREHVSALVNAVFWASLDQVEGRPTTLSIAYLPPEQSDRPFCFAEPLSLKPHALSKVAPSAERPGIHFGAWPGEDGDLAVWGMTRSIPLLCFVLEVVSPGVIVVKHRQVGRDSKFSNAAVLAGDEAKFITGLAPETLECTTMLAPLLRRGPRHANGRLLDPANTFVKLALSMRAHRRGGTLLVVPGDDAWRESISEPILYASRKPYTELGDLTHRAARAEERKRYRTSLGRAVDAIAGLTAVDGATIVTDALDVLAFGAKIVRRKGHPVVESVLVSEPVEGNAVGRESTATLGGTRHLSAAQFVQDQRNALAMVASQDGRFTIFEWSARNESVHAHRIDVLLM